MSREELGDNWYRYTLDFSAAFGALQVAQVLEAAHAEFVFTSVDSTTTPYVYISSMSVEYPNIASLPKAQLTLSDDVLTWGKVRSAYSYTVFEDGVEKITINKDEPLTYTCENNDNGCHELKVVARPDNRGYYTESKSDIAYRRIREESKEENDLSNEFSAIYDCQLTNDNDDFRVGSKSIRYTSTKTSAAARIPVSFLEGITGKKITFYTKVIDHSQMSNQYVHLVFAYLDASGKRIGHAVTQYLNFGTGNHANTLGSVEKLGDTGWNKNSFDLDDAAFNVAPADAAYLRLQVSEIVAFNIDGMTVADTPTA